MKPLRQEENTGTTLGSGKEWNIAAFTGGMKGGKKRQTLWCYALSFIEEVNLKVCRF